jgi:hypothetical protein
MTDPRTEALIRAELARVRRAAGTVDGDEVSPPIGGRDHLSSQKHRVLPEALTDRRRLRCPDCSAWHSGEHDVDGVTVPSVRCADHAADEWRLRWGVRSVDDDPRMPALRYRPRLIPAARFERVLEALARRSDLR